MKMIRGTLKLALVLYICAALSGVYVLSASARITPHEGDDDTMLITIEKGDTLWDLCQEHLKDPLQWRELSKYNDFTNPHLIYPGEQLRIPIAMAKDVVQIAEGDLLKQQQELEKLKAELAESEATRDKLEAEISGLNENMAKLKAQLKDLEDSLKSQKELMVAVTDSGNEIASGIEKALEAAKTAILKDIAQLGEQLAEVNKMLKDRQMKAEATHAVIEAIQADVKTLLAHVEANQKAINEVKMILEDAKGVHEEPSTSKRALVFLTTAAAGIGWFVMNTIGGRSGE
ncbi:LysM peptidoglycan-binding domain-containing protein [Candidatus Poribacteria bacterium]|nr:LysM peptidoglycan-binding domain-containing protein [Candidatus Poribacteria bacterium]MYG05479.1 LysM peptidoglycan-binding domain-containing protein [Candidatus Poribacteria bacterium]MYK22283.1 LysM peptidoglycan-binding domain-containing protein [Candidatus Poribacteria bacterium]